MASAHSPLYRRILHRIAPFLFRRCPEHNFHWRWDIVCYCCSGLNGMGILVRQKDRWLDAKNGVFVPVPHWAK